MFDNLSIFPNDLGIHTLFLLLILIALEAVLSADNAIALATIAQGLEDPKLENRALNLGLVMAFVLRVGLILSASWVTKYWQFELLGATYLLWLVGQYFIQEKAADAEHRHRSPRFTALWQAIPIIAFTDLSFSLDSVTAAIAVSQEIWLIVMGGLIGVIALRFMAGLFLRWLDEFVYLRDAGYITVALVGLRLLARVVIPHLVPPQWVMISLIALIFAWGFSRRVDTPDDPQSSENPG